MGKCTYRPVFFLWMEVHLTSPKRSKTTAQLFLSRILFTMLWLLICWIHTDLEPFLGRSYHCFILIFSYRENWSLPTIFPNQMQSYSTSPMQKWFWLWRKLEVLPVRLCKALHASPARYVRANEWFGLCVSFEEHHSLWSQKTTGNFKCVIEQCYVYVLSHINPIACDVQNH